MEYPVVIQFCGYFFKLPAEYCSHLQIFQCCQCYKRLGDLVRSGNAEMASSMRRAARNIATLKRDAAAVRGIFACYDIEERCLAGSIGAHQPYNFALSDLKAYVLQRNQPAKPLGYSSY